MDYDKIELLPWLPEVTDMVRAEFNHLNKQLHGQQPDLEDERASLQLNVQGWKQSLGNKDLDPRIRNSLEMEWAAAEERIETIERQLATIERRDERASDLVSESEVLQRLYTLSDVLANNVPTRGNLELSLHIDRITCHANGKVELRTCKLGSLPEVVELLVDSTPKVVPQTEITTGRTDRHNAKRRNGPRRRGRLRIGDGDAGHEARRKEVADFVADPFRFADLGDEWFWTDTFQIPIKRSWVEEHAEAVLRRRQELVKETGRTPSLNQLSREFGKSRPTIKTAIDIATGNRPTRSRRGKRKYTAPLDENQQKEIVRLYHEEELEQQQVADRLRIHRNTVFRILDKEDKKRGEKRLDGRRRRRIRKAGGSNANPSRGGPA